jgi:hypothetical protein
LLLLFCILLLNCFVFNKAITVAFQFIYFGSLPISSLYVWYGIQSSSISTVSAALKTRLAEEQIASTMILGDPLDSLAKNLAIKLSKACGVSVFVAQEDESLLEGPHRLFIEKTLLEEIHKLTESEKN